MKQICLPTVILFLSYDIHFKKSTTYSYPNYYYLTSFFNKKKLNIPFHSVNVMMVGRMLILPYKTVVYCIEIGKQSEILVDKKT